MAERPNSNLVFIINTLTEPENPRKKSLDQAVVRSHVAKVSYRRRNAQESDPSSKPRLLQSRPYQPPIRGKTYAVPSSRVDPFDTLGFQLTPEMLLTIQFHVQTYLPSLYVYPFIQRLSEKMPDKVSLCSTAIGLVEGNLRQGFDHKICASAWIGAHANQPSPRQYTGRSMNNMKRTALQLKAHALTSLQDRVSKLPNLDQIEDSLAMQVVLVHEIASKEKRYEDARTHARLLSLILNVLLDGPLMVDIFTTTMYNDIELAVGQMKRTTLDFHRCFCDKLTAFWLRYATRIPQLSKVDEDLPPCIAMPALRTIFARLRHFMRMNDSEGVVDVPNDPDSGPIIYAWITSMTHYDSGILLNLYLDLMDHQIDIAPFERYMQAAIALTLLHLLRRYIYETPLRGTTSILRDAGEAIMSALQKTIRLAIQSSTEAEFSGNAEAWLWIYFAGAQHEVRLESMTTNVASEAPRWFRAMLARQARRLSISKWSEARSVLQQFLYTDFCEPNGENWFESNIVFVRQVGYWPNLRPVNGIPSRLL